MVTRYRWCLLSRALRQVTFNEAVGIFFQGGKEPGGRVYSQQVRSIGVEKAVLNVDELPTLKLRGALNPRDDTYTGTTRLRLFIGRTSSEIEHSPAIHRIAAGFLVMSSK
jgi:hypothetical protein